MSLPIGYRPERIDALRLQTLRAVDELARLRCSDPVAADAMRSIRSTRRTLEEHWMPLITIIRASDAMVSWTRAALTGLRPFGDIAGDWFTFDDASRGRPTRYAGLSDDELIEQLFAAGQSHLGSLASGSFGQSFDDLMASTHPFWSEQFPEMATEISRRVADDSAFARRAVVDMADVPLLAVAIAHAEFPVGYVRDGLVQLLQNPEWSDDVYTAGVRTAAGQLLEAERASLLDVLLDRAALLSLMEPTRLDDDMVIGLIRGGLYDAVMAEPGRLADGARVLRSLTELANDELDRGATEAGSLAVADSMMLYIDHIAPGIIGTSSTSLVHMVDDPATQLDEPLGTYPDVKDLFGMLLRHESARATIALAVVGYTDHIVAELGADIVDRAGVEFVARFAHLLGDALHDERLEEAMAAATTSARRQRVGHLIGFGASVGLIGAGIGPILRGVSGEVVGSVSAEVSDVDPDEIGDSSFGMLAYNSITFSALEHVSSTPAARDELGVGDVTRRQWSALDHHLAQVAALDAGPERQKKEFDLTLFVRETVPELGVFVRKVRVAANDRMALDTTAADLGDDDHDR